MWSEEEFQAHLDEHPDDHMARQVFADWLDEHDDPRGLGYRALGVQKVRPLRVTGLQGNYGRTFTSWFYFSRSDGWQPERPWDVPGVWFEAIREGGDWFGPPIVPRSRQNTEDAAALAFAKLHPERQAELLKTPAMSAA